MGDDEFFSSAGPNAPRNSFSIDELVALSRRLLNIAFALYWESPVVIQSRRVPSLTGISLESARAKVTRCLLAIHAREYV